MCTTDSSPFLPYVLSSLWTDSKFSLGIAKSVRHILKNGRRFEMYTYYKNQCLMSMQWFIQTWKSVCMYSMYVFLKSKQISLPCQSKYKHVTLAPFVPPFCITVTEYDIRQSMESSIKWIFSHVIICDVNSLLREDAVLSSTWLQPRPQPFADLLSFESISCTRYFKWLHHWFQAHNPRTFKNLYQRKESIVEFPWKCYWLLNLKEGYRKSS